MFLQVEILILPEREKIPFEIPYNKEIGWIPVIKGYDEPYKVVPKKVFDEILNIAKETATIIMNHSIRISDGRMFEVTFEWHEQSYYSGIIIEKGKRFTERKKETGKLIENEIFPDKKVDRLKLLLKYLIAQKSFCDYILSEFQHKWKPLIDNEFLVN